jgi:hypothetical protein
MDKIEGLVTTVTRVARDGRYVDLGMRSEDGDRLPTFWKREDEGAPPVATQGPPRGMEQSQHAQAVAALPESMGVSPTANSGDTWNPGPGVATKTMGQ